MLGYEPEDLIGNHYKMIVHPDDYKLINRDNVIKTYKEKSNIMRETVKLFDERRRGPRKTMGLEVRLIPKNWKPDSYNSSVVIGTVTAFGEISSQGYYKDDYESFLGTVGIIRDITNRKKSEALLRKLYTAIEQSPVSEIITDREGNIEYVNPAFLHLLGINPGKVLGQSIDILEIDRFAKSEYKSIKEIINSRGEWRGEILSKNRSGEPLWESIVVTPIQNPYGEIENYIIVKLDITKQRLAQEELQKAHDELDSRVKERTAELEKANKELKDEIAERKRFEDALKQSQKMQTIGTLAGGIAHDFNNILSAIFGYANMANKKINDTKQVSLNIQQIITAANRAKDIIEQILIFSKRIKKKRIHVNLGSTIKEVISLIKVSIPDSVKIIKKIDTDLECVLADPSQIFQVLMNLCTNSCYAMRSTGGILEISVKPVIVDSELSLKSTVLHKGKYLQIDVKDTGSGMDKKVLDRAFEPFFTTKQATEGTGLGLSVVHGIIMSHGGEIFIESELCKGTKVTVYLPQDDMSDRQVKEESPEEDKENESFLF
jgi:PAS domain S-box-containing protein